VHDLLTSRPLTQGVLARLDVRVKLIPAMAAIVAVIVSSRPTLPLAVFVICLAGAIASRGSLRPMLARLAGPFLVAGAICLLKVFFSGSTPLRSFDLLGWRLTATGEGLAEGVLLGSRVLGSVSVMIVLFRWTPAHEVFAAMRWARMPRSAVEIAMLMYRYVFALFEQAASVVAAQKVRLGYSSLPRSLTSMGSLAGIVTLRAIDQADKTHEAMVARGYRGSLQIPPLPPLTRRSTALLAGSLAVVAGAWVLAQRWPAW